MINEARFNTIEDDISVPEVANEIKKWIKAFRKKHSNENELRALAKKNRYLYLGTIKLGRKKVNVWVTEMEEGFDGQWVEPKKQSSFVITCLNTIINNPARSLSVIVHELIHGIQKYKKNSEKYHASTTKASNETDEEMFDYYTEPKELEAQLGQLAHDIVQVFQRKKNKQEIIRALEEVLKLPREKFKDVYWISHSTSSKYTWDMFAYHVRMLKIISAVPESQATSLRYKQISDKSWRQFKQKLFNLVQSMKTHLSK